MIKKILDEITNEPGDNAKMAILRKYADNELLQKVMYNALSSRVKFYIKAIPQFLTNETNSISLDAAIDSVLENLSTRNKTGHDASNHLRGLLASMNLDDAYVLTRIIDKDLKIGMGRSNINKIIPDLIEKTPYMGAKSFSEKLARAIFKDGKPAISQIKEDGRYANAIIMDGTLEFISRQGEDTLIGNAPLLVELESLPNCVLNGELTMDGYDRYTANGVITSIIDIEKKREKRTHSETLQAIQEFEDKRGDYQDNLNRIRYTVWDMITPEEYFAKKSIRNYTKRFTELSDMLQKVFPERIGLVESVFVKNYKEAMIHFQDALSRGLEGTVLKSLSGTWKDGKPNWQVKMKLEMSIDLKIIGFEYGTEGTKNENVISTINMESSDGLLKTNPSGMTESMMKLVTDNQEALLGTIAEIRCCGLSQNSKGEWSTLHPSVVALRDDKDTCDSLQSAQEIEEMAKTLA